MDSSQFERGLRRVKTGTALAAKSIGKGFLKVSSVIGNVVKSAAKFAAIMGAITFTAAIAGAVKLAGALRKAFDAGGALSDLSSQTGIAVKQLVILQRAFEDNGVSAEKVGTTINKMQRSISDAGAGLSTQVRAFQKLGMTFDDLEGKSPLQQFTMLQKGIAAIEDPTKRAATAMEIFGRSGGEMLTLFQDGNAISNAMVTVGSAADILDRNANKFDRISDLLNSAGSKLQGFFLGIGEVAADKILPVLEKFNAIDFAAMGQNFAERFNVPDLIELLKTGLIYAGESFIEFFSPKMMKMADSFGRKMVEVINNQMAKTKLGAVLGIKSSGKGVPGAGAIGAVGSGKGDTTSKAAFEAAIDKLFGKTRGKYATFLSGTGKNQPDFLLKPRPASPQEPPSINMKGAAHHVAAGAGGAAPTNHAANAVALMAGRTGTFGALQRSGMAMSTAAGAGFNGIAGIHGMQLARMSGIGPGANSALSRGPKTFGRRKGAIGRNFLGGMDSGTKVSARDREREAAANQEAQLKGVDGTNERLDNLNKMIQKALT
jgi:hypothetical protein